MNTRLKLAFLEGIRGLAALYVVIHHAAAEFLYSFEASAVPQRFRDWAWLFLFERYAVGCFIVLSGFCLALPVLKHPDYTLQGGFVRFMGRRAKRILPAYYATIVFCLALDRFVPGLLLPGNRPGGGLRWDMTAPAFDKDVLLSHLLLIHNTREAWGLRIDYPMWSIATEWQIYFLFPVLILLWRYGGDLALVLGAFGIGIWAWAGAELLSSGASGWYLGLFAMGMVAARVAHSSEAAPLPAYKGALLLLLTELALYRLVLFAGRGGAISQLLQDAVIGVMASALLVACSRAARGGQPGFLIGILEARPVKGLGHFAYSLYLIHAPILAVVHLVLLRWVPDTPARMVWMFLAGVPLAVAVSWLFSLLFERPFMRTRTAEEPLITVAA